MKATRYFTGRACPRGHVAERYASTRACVVCCAEGCRQYQKRPEYAVTKARTREIAQIQRAPKWTSGSERHEIRGMYAASSLIGEMHNIPMNVDHSIPLRGKQVSGLHVLRNLQLLPADENGRKSNHFEVTE